MCKISRFMCKIYRLLCKIYVINCKICTSIKNEKQKLKKKLVIVEKISTSLEKYMKFNKHHNVLYSLLLPTIDSSQFSVEGVANSLSFLLSSNSKS